MYCFHKGWGNKPIRINEIKIKIALDDIILFLKKNTKEQIIKKKLNEKEILVWTATIQKNVDNKILLCKKFLLGFIIIQLNKIEYEIKINAVAYNCDFEDEIKKIITGQESTHKYIKFFSSILRFKSKVFFLKIERIEIKPIKLIKEVNWYALIEIANAFNNSPDPTKLLLLFKKSDGKAPVSKICFAAVIW